MSDDTANGFALETIYDCGAVKVPPWMSLVSALAAVRPASIDDTIDWLVAHRAELGAAYAAGATAPLAGARLPPELERTPELGSHDRARDDNRLRDRSVNADIVGRLTFTQAAIFAITGIELAPRDARMLDEFGTANLLVDRRVWPMAVIRRVGGGGGRFAEAVVAGVAMLGSTMIGGAAFDSCARFLLRVEVAEQAGRSASEVVREALARHERVMGFGRPVVGPDERVPVIERILVRHERSGGPHVERLRRVAAAMVEHKGLTSTAAAWAAAMLLDLGMTPVQVEAVGNFWVGACIYAQAAFSVETRL